MRNLATLLKANRDDDVRVACSAISFPDNIDSKVLHEFTHISLVHFYSQIGSNKGRAHLGKNKEYGWWRKTLCLLSLAKIHKAVKMIE